MNARDGLATAGRTLRGASGSVWLAASLALPLLAVTGLVALGRLSAEAAFGMTAARVWFGALALALPISIGRAIRERRVPDLMALAATALVMLQAIATWAGRFEGTTDAGVLEPSPPWSVRARGPLASLPELEVIDVLPGSPGRARLRIQGEERDLLVGEEGCAGAVCLVASGPYPAPSFRVEGGGGHLEASGLLKLAPARRDPLTVGYLPHRFYVSLIEGTWRPNPALPPKLALRVQRGKLKLFEGEVAPGKRVEFESLSFSYGEGAAWVAIEARRRSQPWLLAAAVVLALLAVAVRWREAGRPT